MIKKRKFFPSVHSIERAREYFGINELHAVDFVTDLARESKFLMVQPDTKRRIVYNEEHDVKLVLGPSDNTVITILPPGKRKQSDASLPKLIAVDKAARHNPIIAAASATIQRELTKARRQFTREYRVLTEEIAVIGLEIAQLSLNKARARSPITQRHITDKVSEIHARQTQLAEQRKQLEAEYSAIKTEAQAFIGEAVTS